MQNITWKHDFFSLHEIIRDSEYSFYALYSKKVEMIHTNDIEITNLPITLMHLLKILISAKILYFKMKIT